ncbi:hypothetical protein [Escherichia coli]|uniref:hypothetical protein n=1 Tax=Escherichia coli TaxID=562 RepID=UPI0019D2A579|nr:hypothetical protein [Escherichia coli]MBN6397319.1 hypothetical protein [Escherichia coli]MBN6462820.1 hypothetical protein [Escherichia coli]MEB7097858.1 hypothetical protein [Escherichia coli]
MTNIPEQMTENGGQSYRKTPLIDTGQKSVVGIRLKSRNNNQRHGMVNAGAR